MTLLIFILQQEKYLKTKLKIKCLVVKDNGKIFTI